MNQALDNLTDKQKLTEKAANNHFWGNKYAEIRRKKISEIRNQIELGDKEND